MKESIAAIVAALAALGAERDALLANDSLTVEQEVRGREIANEIAEKSGKLRAVQLREQFASASVTQKVGEAMNRLEGATENRAYRDQFLRWARGGPAPDASREFEMEVRELITTSSSGVLVPKLVEEKMWKYVDANTVIRNLCNLRTGVKGYAYIRSNNLESAGFTSAWSPPDTGTIAATDVDPTFSEFPLAPATLMPRCVVSQQLLRQSDFDLEGELQDFLQRQIAKNLEFGYVGGATASNQPKGIFTVNASANIQAATSAGTTRAAAVTAGATLDNLLSMRYSKLPASMWGRARWIMPQDFYAAVAQIKVNNVPILVPSGDFQPYENSAPFTLFGLPVDVTEYLPAHVSTGTTGKNVVACLGVLDDAYAAREWAGVGMVRDEITSPGKVKLTGMVFAQGEFVLHKSLVQLQVTNA